MKKLVVVFVVGQLLAMDDRSALLNKSDAENYLAIMRQPNNVVVIQRGEQKRSKPCMTPAQGRLCLSTACAAGGCITGGVGCGFAFCCGSVVNMVAAKACIAGFVIGAAGFAGCFVSAQETDLEKARR